jgi:hypothetical protein
MYQMMRSGDVAPQTAILHLQVAIDIMDCCSAPADIAAHADLAIARLEEWISGFERTGIAPAGFEPSVRPSVSGH